MSAGESLEKTMSRAAEFEKNYDWMGSVELYRTALGMVPELDVVKAGEFHERIGYGLFRAAMQADSVEEFKKRMRMSVEAYEKAAELLGGVEPARGLYCGAMARYSNFWFVEKPSQKKELLDDCWKLMKEALERFDRVGDHLSYGKAFHSLSFCIWDRGDFVDDWREGERIVDEVIRYGQNATKKLSQVGDVNELAWSYTMTALIIVYYVDWFFWERRNEFASIVSNYLEKALGLSEKIEDAYLHGFLCAALCWNSFYIAGDLQAALRHGEKSLQQSERSNDHFLLGLAYFLLNYVTHWAAITEEDPDKWKEKVKIGMRFAEESIRHNLIVCRYEWVSLAYSVHLIDSYLDLAELETSLEGKRSLLGRAVEVGRKGSEYAQLSDSPLGIMHMFHVLSKAVFFLSETETSISGKNKPLEEALELREKCIKISDQLLPPYQWVRGVFQNYLALIKADSAKLEKSEEKKRYLLEEAVSSMEKCLETCTKSLQTGVSLPGPFAVLGWYHDWFGEILNQLYLLTKDEKVINRAIEVYQGSAQVYQKAGMHSRVAEAYWKAAKLYDRRGEYAKAADNFEQASTNYQLVAETIPQFKCFYEDHKSYMQAWSEFEKAKQAHQKEQYEQAKTRYESAANLLKSTKRWGYLAPNFAAWATLEQAEDLSKQEKSDESRQAFQQAANQFAQAKTSLQDEAKNRGPRGKSQDT